MSVWRMGLGQGLGVSLLVVGRENPTQYGVDESVQTSVTQWQRDSSSRPPLTPASGGEKGSYRCQQKQHHWQT
ncbi:hypothetical protein Micbo1qcDRAFT_53242 [Microdochium bolleyi]|uniref:Uncharacterized protein n=1 Tax=Microdochium bolleyi TaxID=196109 RepID=A0A136J7J1_9PEZI|nr:hypothetical protein Micbo1qcDRAFT_53242 [Microdochium bolleyi]